MLKLNPKEYAEMLKLCYLTKQPLFVSGGPGIGKSAVPRQLFRDIAKQEKRTFVEWADLTLDQKQDCVHNAEKYWIFADLRTSQMDTTSLTGIPNMANTEMLENIPYSWVVALSNPKAAGAIFFDEINLAAPIVQSITYSAIHDRVIADRRIANGVYIFAAGNRSQDKAHTFEMPLPLRDRFAEFEVATDVDTWLEWANTVGINSHLQAFIKFQPTRLYNAGDSSKVDKVTTPRGIERASRLIGDLRLEAFTDNANKDNTSDKIHALVSISCGEAFAAQFQAYCKCYRSLNWDKILANPSTVSKMSLDEQYAIAGGIVDRWRKATENTPVKNDVLKQMFHVLDNMRTDLAIFGFSMIITSVPEIRQREIKRIIDMKLSSVWIEKYSKFTM